MCVTAVDSFIFLCTLIAQAACRPTIGALNTTVQMMQEEMKKAMVHLNESGLVPSNSCNSLMAKFTGLGEGPLTTGNLSSFRCYMMKLSELTPELATYVQTTSQYAQSVEKLMSNQTAPLDCSLPHMERDMDAYLNLSCLLSLLDQRLSNIQS
ncbi:uncharacterized protein V6R79_020706 [Siganus canaliculatus]